MRLPQSSSRFLSTLIVVGVILTLRSQVVAQQLVCSPASVGFGSVDIGQSETQLVVLTNTGQTSATISAISSTNSNFAVSGEILPVVLAAGESAGFNVTFSPTATQWTGGQITFTSNASNPSLKLSAGGVGVRSTALSAAPESLSFGQVAVGSSSTLAVVLTNTRTWGVTLSALQTVGSEFSFKAPALPLTLNGGQSITLNVTFKPQSAGPTGGTVVITGPGVQTVPLNGTGATVAAAQLSLGTAVLNFGDVNVGSTTTLPSTLTATGGSVTVSSATSNSTQFSITGASFPLTIAAGETVQFDAVFSPSKSGTFSGSLTFSSNASDPQVSESVNGTGVTQQYSVNLSWSPSGSASIAGYNVYRGTVLGAYSRINSSLDENTAYTDSTVASGVTYYYVATTVNTSGQESGYSAALQVAVP